MAHSSSWQLLNQIDNCHNNSCGKLPQHDWQPMHTATCTCTHVHWICQSESYIKMFTSCLIVYTTCNHVPPPPHTHTPTHTPPHPPAWNKDFRSRSNFGCFCVNIAPGLYEYIQFCFRTRSILPFSRGKFAPCSCLFQALTHTHFNVKAIGFQSDLKLFRNNVNILINFAHPELCSLWIYLYYPLGVKLLGTTHSWKP